MQMIRLTLDDSNLQKRNDRLIWDIPLNVENHKVGLSSIALDVADHYDPNEHKFVKIKCNLIAINMHNQQGVLATLRRNEESYNTFQISAIKTGKASKIFK